MIGHVTHRRRGKSISHAVGRQVELRLGDRGWVDKNAVPELNARQHHERVGVISGPGTMLTHESLHTGHVEVAALAGRPAEDNGLNRPPEWAA